MRTRKPYQDVFSPLGDWLAQSLDEWTTAPLRAPIKTLLDDYVTTRTWITHWRVVERFIGNDDISRQSMRGPRSLQEKADYQKSRRCPVLLFSVQRTDTQWFEVGYQFPMGANSDVLDVSTLVQSLDVSKP